MKSSIIRIMLGALLVLPLLAACSGSMMKAADSIVTDGNTVGTPPCVNSDADIPPAANGSQGGAGKATFPPDGRDYEDEYVSGYTVKTDNPPDKIAGIQFYDAGKTFSGTKWRSDRLSSEQAYKDVQKELISIYGDPLSKSYSEKRSLRTVQWMTEDSKFSLSLLFYKYPDMMYLEMQVVRWP